MRRVNRFALASFIFLFLCCPPAHAQMPAGFTTLEIGDAAPDFDLPGIDDKNHQLAEYSGAKVLMVLFTCNHCPTAQAYEQRINQLYADYSEKGLALVAISPNDPTAVRLDELGYSDLGDTLADMKVRAKEAGYKYPYLYDGENQKVSLAYGVLATPHVFIFDQQRKLQYKGRIDDSEVKTPTSHDAKNAIDALLAAKEVPVQVTRPFGCSTKWMTKRASAAKSIKKWSAEPVELSTIDQTELASLVANKTDKYRLINIWATWCAPCIEELPAFVEMNRMYRKRPFEMVTVCADAIDAKENALTILKDKNVSCRNVLFDSTEDQDVLFDTVDAKWEGGVPYTLLIAPGGEVIYRQHAAIDPAALKKIIADKLGRTYASKKKKK